MYEILVFDLPYLNVCLLEFTARMLCSFVLKILKLHVFLEHNLLLNSTVRKSILTHVDIEFLFECLTQ